MTGYKAFDKDLMCRDFQYELGGEYKFDGKPIPCNQGFHFCKTIADCYKFYSMSENTRICKIEAMGDIESDDGIKFCTNHIKVIEEVTDFNLKRGNSSDNSGYCNSGNRNSGDWNSGNRNSGYCNSGDWNSGNRNSGNWNSGYCNSGDWNSGNRNSGCFNETTPTMRFFDLDTDWDYIDWLESPQRGLLNEIPCKCVEWVSEKDMSENEKRENPEYKTTGGYLKILDEKESTQIWWDGLSNDKKNCIRKLPNYDEQKFARILGIKI